MPLTQAPTHSPPPPAPNNSVPDVAAACKRFEELGVEFVKKPQDGKMK